MSSASDERPKAEVDASKGSNVIDVEIPNPVSIIPDPMSIELLDKLAANPAGWVFLMVGLLSRPTPEQYISHHEGPQKSVISYVAGSYAKATRAALTRLGIISDFEVIQTEVDKGEDLEVSCLSRLTFKYCHSGLVQSVISTQWGGCKKRSGMTWGNARKGATTDSLKKCLSEFGWAADIYAAEPEVYVAPDKSDLKAQSIETLYNIGSRAGMTKEQVDDFVSEETEGKTTEDLDVKDLAAIKRKITRLGSAQGE